MSRNNAENGVIVGQENLRYQNKILYAKNFLNKKFYNNKKKCFLTNDVLDVIRFNMFYYGNSHLVNHLNIEPIIKWYNKMSILIFQLVSISNI